MERPSEADAAGQPRSLPRSRKEEVHLGRSVARCGGAVIRATPRRSRSRVALPDMSFRPAPGYPPPAPMRSSLPPKLQHVCNRTATTLRRSVHRQNRAVPDDALLSLFPDTVALDGGALTLGGLPAAELVARHGSPLVVYDEATLRAT